MSLKTELSLSELRRISAENAAECNAIESRLSNSRDIWRERCELLEKENKRQQELINRLLSMLEKLQVEKENK